jgi:type 1 fimbria pilin
MTIFNGCDRSTTVNFSISLRNCTSTRLASAEGESTLGLSINLAPNPVRDYLTATIEGVEGQTIQLQLIDAQGRSRQQATVEASEGKAQHRFDVRSLPAGMYLLQAETATQRATKKVIRID